jgi:hypothetical protein
VRVILDADLAALYGVSTKRLNEQFRRNRRRFPDDFAFQLTAEEAAALRSQIATLFLTPSSIRSQNATASKRNVRYRPWAFTEHGALQADSALRDIYQKLLPLLSPPPDPPRGRSVSSLEQMTLLTAHL